MKAKLFILAGLLAVMMAMAALVSAQDATQEAEPSCSSDQWAEIAPNIVEVANKLGTEDDPLVVLMIIEAIITDARSSCGGGNWSSDDYGTGSSVIGPVIFSGTLYQGTLKSDVSALISFTAIEGNCGYESLSVLFADKEGNPNEDTALLKFDGCVAYFEVDGYGDPWTLTIEKLK